MSSCLSIADLHVVVQCHNEQPISIDLQIGRGAFCVVGDAGSLEQQLYAWWESYREGAVEPIQGLITSGTPFQQAVYRQLEMIPYGELVTYGTVAEQIGSRRAARAVGSACNRNPLPLRLPCHRVVGAKKLTGFRFGLEIKQLLIDHERRFA